METEFFTESELQALDNERIELGLVISNPSLLERLKRPGIKEEFFNEWKGKLGFDYENNKFILEEDLASREAVHALVESGKFDIFDFYQLTPEKLRELANDERYKIKGISYPPATVTKRPIVIVGVYGINKEKDKDIILNLERRLRELESHKSSEFFVILPHLLLKKEKHSDFDLSKPAIDLEKEIKNSEGLEAVKLLLQTFHRNDGKPLLDPYPVDISNPSLNIPAQLYNQILLLYGVMANLSGRGLSTLDSIARYLGLKGKINVERFSALEPNTVWILPLEYCLFGIDKALQKAKTEFERILRSPYILRFLRGNIRLTSYYQKKDGIEKIRYTRYPISYVMLVEKKI
ncbi:hypothetical protein DRJ16_02935 [Candidatus Woesearchaeota archaeon]|nr:MAG: hypothetical protein DRJ16_02935 [Candidatus Woesearchaeota archaeon]